MRKSIGWFTFVTSFFFCFLAIGFLFHTASSLANSQRQVTLEFAEPHAVIGHKDEDGWPHLEFKSSSLQPPKLEINGEASENAGIYLFMTPKGPHKENGRPAIYTLEGDLVFIDETHDHTSDFKPQTHQDERRLTFSHGHSTGAPNPGHGYGKVVLLDSEYQQIEFDLNATINTLLDHPPGHLDFHEHIMSANDTMYVTAYNNTPQDLSPIGGPKDGWIVDSMFFEIEPSSGKVLSSWSAIDHILLSDSRLPLPSYMGNGTKAAPFDHFHLNSMQPLGDDSLLISSRHTWCSYILDRASGEVLQTIDGFEHDFSWQHHARAHNWSENKPFTMTLFDNHNQKDDKGGNFTQGLIFEVDRNIGKVSLLQSFKTDFYADSQGSLQALNNGNFLLGGGRIPKLLEYSSAGEVVWKARFEKGERGYSYRTFRGDWSGTPRDWDPSLVVEQDKAYVSWNGATEVEEWNVYVDDRLRGTVKKQGFETMIHMKGLADKGCVKVGALQGSEEVRVSNAVCSTDP